MTLTITPPYTPGAFHSEKHQSPPADPGETQGASGVKWFCWLLGPVTGLAISCFGDTVQLLCQNRERLLTQLLLTLLCSHCHIQGLRCLSYTPLAPEGGQLFGAYCSLFLGTQNKLPNAYQYSSGGLVQHSPPSVETHPSTSPLS